MIINGYELVLTCSACPEQYNVFKEGEQVAYLRLRHGWFYASCPDCCDDIVYEAEANGDGEFDDDEREKYLTEAINAVDKWCAVGLGDGEEMSMHNIPITDLEREGLEKHGLKIGVPSQLSDCFRAGIAWALRPENQKCCEGGPHWGHSYGCPKAPD